MCIVLKKIICFHSLLFLAPIIAFTQSLRQPISGGYVALGSYSDQQADAFCFGHNQAALAQANTVSMALFGEQRFSIGATRFYNAIVAMPTPKGNFGIQLKYGGFKNFNESELGLAYARNVGKKLAVGIQFNYYGYQIPAYNSASTVCFELGALVHLTEALNLGFHTYNPVGGQLSKTGDKLTSAYTLGLGYDVSDLFFVSAEMIKEENFPVNVNAGVQYQWRKQFFARVGIATATSTPNAGLGIGWGQFRMDVTASYHPVLGLSPGLLLVMQLGKKTPLVTESNSN